jgi:CDP-diacylglycerol--glycerol-3-phosphate 3-phosphatidyltransferase
VERVAVLDRAASEALAGRGSAGAAGRAAIAHNRGGMFTLNWPNFLTVMRILLVPVLVVALLAETSDGDVLAAVVFAAASLTDFVYGYLARTRNSITNFGKLMDPLADKLLIIAALVALVSLHRLAAWGAMVIITREFAVTVLRMAANQAGVVMAASMFGKVKTCVQIATIMAVIAVRGQPLWVELMIYATVVVTVLSGLDYFFGIRKRMNAAAARPADPAATAAAAGEAPSRSA